MKLSELIKKYRLENDLSQREFSKRCDISNSYISFIENECNPKTGKPMTPTIEQYKKIANGMSITIQELFESLDKDAPVILTRKKAPPMNLQLFAGNPDEERLISGYRSLTPHGQALLKDRCEELKLLYGKNLKIVQLSLFK